MGGKGEGSRQRSGEGKANLSVRKCGTEQRAHILCQQPLEIGSVRSCAGRRQAQDSVGRNRQNDLRGSRVCWSFQHLSSFVPTSDSHAYYPDQLHTKFSFSPLLSGRWWESLNIYEASGTLVALMNACLRTGTRNPAKGPPHSSWPRSSQARKKAGRMKGGEAVARRETNGPATQKKEQSSIFARWSALEWVGMCVKQGSNSPDSQVGNEFPRRQRTYPHFLLSPTFSC